MLNYSGGLISKKLAAFAIEVENGCILANRSKALLSDLYFVSGYLYDQASLSLLSDGAYDRLVHYLMGDFDNVRQTLIRGHEIHFDLETLKTGTAAYPPEIGGLAMDTIFVWKEIHTNNGTLDQT